MIFKINCTEKKGWSNIFGLIYSQAARETGALKEAKDMLEKKVEELQIRLQLDKIAKVLFCAI